MTELDFRPPSDQDAALLLWSWMRLKGREDDPHAHAAFWRRLAQLCRTPADRALVLATRTALEKSDPVCSWPIGAHWLALQFRDDTPALISGRHAEAMSYSVARSLAGV